MAFLAPVAGLFSLASAGIQVVKAGIELTQRFNTAFNNSDPSSLTFGQAANNFTNRVQTFNQQLSSSTQERTEETADEKRRLELEQLQLDYTNRFNLQEQQFTPHEFFEPQQTTYPT